MTRHCCGRMIGSQSLATPAQVEKGAFGAPDLPQLGRAQQQDWRWQSQGIDCQVATAPPAANVAFPNCPLRNPINS